MFGVRPLDGAHNFFDGRRRQAGRTRRWEAPGSAG